MQNEYFKAMNDLSTNAMDAAKALGEINSKILEKTIALQMQATDLSGAPLWAFAYGANLFARGESIGN